MVLEDVPADVLAMYRVYAEDATVAEVAERFGRPERRVRALFHDCGLPVRKAGSRRDRLPLPASDAPRRRAAEAERQAAEDERARVERDRREAAGRERAAKAAARRERAVARVRTMYARYEAGATLREAAAEFGISEGRVSQLFKRAGLATRTASARGHQ